MSFVAVAFAAGAVGLLGSLHCAGMCGPLAIAGCSKGRGMDGAAGYFVGRLLAYVTLGAVVGHFGRHALCILPVNAAHALAIVLTAVPAAARSVTLLLGRPKDDFVPLRKKPKKRLLTMLASLLPRRGLGLGLATGILPCGLLLTAFAMAAGTASPVLGATSMAAFAVGSLPGLVLPLVGRGVAERLHLRVPPRIEGLLWGALSVWLAVRLALGDQGCHPGMGPM